jgi:diguanylate cyclase (GGDEF)-like protein
MKSVKGAVAHELVPLADRLRYMQALRLVLAAAVVVYTALIPAAQGVAYPTIVGVSALYLAVTAAGYGAWTLWRGRGITLFGGLVILDGVYLSWASYATGGPGSPLRYLIVVHLMMVALLASYRTAMKIAMWHSLMLFATFHAVRADVIRPITLGGGDLPGSDFQRMAVFVAMLWLAAIGTASFAAVNERELRRRKVDLELLARMAHDMEAASSPTHAATILRDSLIDGYGFPEVVVAGEVGGTFVPLAAGTAVVTPHAEPDRVAAAAWATRQTQLITELDADTNPVLAELLPGARNVVVVPLFADGRAVGVVAAEHGLRRGSRIERRVVTMIERFSSHAALVLRNAWLVEQLQKVAATDPLTGLANRRTFEETLHRELGRSLRTRDPLTLMMIDLDHFKQLNDTYGHPAGDKVLRSVAAVLARECREFDVVARYGGEEFAVIAPSCGEDDAKQLAERLRAAVTEVDDPSPITASIGIAVFREGAADEPALVRAADRALYRAKRAGRDRVFGPVSRSRSPRRTVA